MRNDHYLKSLTLSYGQEGGQTSANRPLGGAYAETAATGIFFAQAFQLGSAERSLGEVEQDALLDQMSAELSAH